MSKVLGKVGEDLACEILKKNHYKILERNFLTRFGEIDVVTKEGDVLVFVEVKFRKNEGFGTATEFVTDRKIKKILKTARIYLNEKDLDDIDWRIDVLGIDAETKAFELIKNVFIEGL